MKKNFVNYHQFSGHLEDARLAHRYNSLLEDYSEIEKECDYKKRKLQVERQKQKILVDEVRFLRQRHAFLTKLQMEELGPSQSNGSEEPVGKTMTITDKPLDLSTNEKKSGKKKVSWNDNVEVRII